MAGQLMEHRRRRRHRHRHRHRHLLFSVRSRRPFFTLHLLCCRRARARRHRPAPPPAFDKPPSPATDQMQQKKTGEFEEVSGEASGMVTSEMVAREIRLRYVHGLQLMIQLQCEALVRDLGVSPIVCGIVGGVWMRLVMVSRVFDEKRTKTVLNRLERKIYARYRKQASSRNMKCDSRYKGKPCYSKYLPQRWLLFLKKQLPLCSTLTTTFLACHIARQPVLPTDIVKWALESKLPYIAVHVELENLLEEPSSVCPITSRKLFKPVSVVGAWLLETMAAVTLGSIGLRLPAVNFYAIAYRYIDQLSLPVERILDSACRVYEWSFPAELCLVAHRLSLPTRVYVAAVLIITIRIMYNINGQGFWEANTPSYQGSSSRRKYSTSYHLASENKCEEKKRKSVNPDDICHGSENRAGDNDTHMENIHTQSTSTSQHISGSRSSTWELLHTLEEAYYKIDDDYDHSKDFTTYLKYCKDVIFAGRKKPSAEEDLMEQFWNFYGQKMANDLFEGESESQGRKRSREACKKEHDDKGADLEREASNEVQDNDDTYPQPQFKFVKTRNAANAYMRKFKSDMESNYFIYIPPKVQEAPENVYVRYYRKQQMGKLFYVAHADYYLVLRAFAKVAQVDCRILHLGVLNVERRLAWIEDRIARSLVLLQDNTLEDMINGTCEDLEDLQL